MQFEKLPNLNNNPVTEESFIGAKLALITSFTFLGVNYGLIFLLWFFMVSDSILGVWKSYSLYGSESITKARFYVGFGTKIAILFLPLSLALIGALAGVNLNIFVLTAIYTLIANDLASCYTNILSVKRGRDIANKDLVVLLINTFRQLIYSGVKEAIKKLKDSEACPPDEDTKPKLKR
jgi:hypothetical protein